MFKPNLFTLIQVVGCTRPRERDGKEKVTKAGKPIWRINAVFETENGNVCKDINSLVELSEGAQEVRLEAFAFKDSTEVKYRIVEVA